MTDATASKRALTVEQALARVLAGVASISDTVELDLLAARGAVLAAPVIATATQPPFDASAMDGFAVHADDVTHLPATLRVVGESAAGHGFHARLQRGEAARIFTGAPMPPGATAVVIQENTRREADCVVVIDGSPDRDHIRPAGGDFARGQTLLKAGTVLGARDLTLAAAAGYPKLTVRRSPTVAILATGDELVMPGTAPAQDQIVCSNPFGVAALVAGAGGTPRLLGIARDTRDSLNEHLDAAEGVDILVTLGGASVGDYDLVAPVLRERGLLLDFWNIAMRPGKPMMFGQLGPQRILGLPGNPVSSMITARLFLVPLIRALLGLPPAPDQALTARLATATGANGTRAHYMRAYMSLDSVGERVVHPMPNQDSSLLTPLAAANCLIVRPIGAPGLEAGQAVPILPLDF